MYISYVNSRSTNPFLIFMIIVLFYADMPCMFCGGLEHFASCCPLNPTSINLPQNMRNMGIVSAKEVVVTSPESGQTRCCYKCGVPGHIAKDCTSTEKRARTEAVDANSRCMTCGGTFHFTTSCPSTIRKSKKDICERCDILYGKIEHVGDADVDQTQLRADLRKLVGELLALHAHQNFHRGTDREVTCRFLKK